MTKLYRSLRNQQNNRNNHIVGKLAIEFILQYNWLHTLELSKHLLCALFLYQWEAVKHGHRYGIDMIGYGYSNKKNFEKLRHKYA